jgi:predicted ArsR family transcriptional regulator
VSTDLHEPLTGRPYFRAQMDESSLEEAILLALRQAPGSRSDQLAEAVGLPRTNFGRRLKNRLRRPLQRLLAGGLVGEERGRYQLTEKGRTTLAERFDAIQ